MGRLERRVGGLDRPQLVEHRQEAAVVRRAPVAAGALALLDDVLDGLTGGRRVDDRHQLAASRTTRALSLGLLRADEQLLLADLVGQVDDAGLDRSVEVTDGVELLAPRDDVGRRP